MTLYSATFQNVAVSAQQDLFEIVAPAGGVVVLHRAVISQTSEVGDAAEEGLSLLLKRGATTSGSGGTAVTPNALALPAAAFAGTVEANNTTKATAGTIVTLHAEAWNVRGPFDWFPSPEARVVLAPGQRATLELATTPADALTVSGVLVFEAVGG